MQRVSAIHFKDTVGFASEPAGQLYFHRMSFALGLESSGLPPGLPQFLRNDPSRPMLHALLLFAPGLALAEVAFQPIQDPRDKLLAPPAPSAPDLSILRLIRILQPQRFRSGSVT